MKADWSRLDAALERRPPTVWWRDDDAIAPSSQLDRLIGLSERIGAELTLAVIPSGTTEALATAIEGHPVTAAVHGWQHRNHAPDGEKNAEFGAHRPLEALIEEAHRGKTCIDEIFGAAALPLFVPPWNRISDELLAALVETGFEAISIYGQREIGTDALIRFDAHIDPIDWRGSRSAVDKTALIDSIIPLLESDAPIGLMTHHLVHDDAIWALVETLTNHFTRYGAKWTCAATLIEAGRLAHGKKPR